MLGVVGTADGAAGRGAAQPPAAVIGKLQRRQARRLFTLAPEASIVPAMERAGLGGGSATGRGVRNRLGLFFSGAGHQQGSGRY